MYTLAQTEQMVENHPDSFLVKNLQELNINYKKMGESDPFLFTYCTSLLSVQMSDTTKLLWDHYQCAYKELKEAGFFQNMSKIDYFSSIEVLQRKVTGPRLIPLKELKESTHETMNHDVKTIEFSYPKFSLLIEKYYQINLHDFFKSLIEKKIGQMYKNYLGACPATIHKLAVMSPRDSIPATKLCIIADIISQDIILLDFWHYLLLTDFQPVSTNGTQQMGVSHIQVQHSIYPEIYNQTLFLIRSIFLKEAKVIYGCKDIEYLQFHIEV